MPLFLPSEPAFRPHPHDRCLEALCFGPFENLLGGFLYAIVSESIFNRVHEHRCTYSQHETVGRFVSCSSEWKSCRGAPGVKCAPAFVLTQIVLLPPVQICAALYIFSILLGIFSHMRPPGVDGLSASTEAPFCTRSAGLCWTVITGHQTGRQEAKLDCGGNPEDSS